MKLDLLTEKMKEYLEADDTRDFIIGEDTAKAMALVAHNVLLAIRESQKYGVKEGYFKE